MTSKSRVLEKTKDIELLIKIIIKTKQIAKRNL